MSPARYQQIRHSFESLLELTEEQRSSALEKARADDPELAHEIEALISVYRRRSDFIEEPVVSLRPLATMAVLPSDLRGSAFGAFRLEERIGEGGMGEV